MSGYMQVTNEMICLTAHTSQSTTYIFLVKIPLFFYEFFLS